MEKDKIEIPVYAAEFDETKTEGISMMSFVKSPAIRRNFIALSEVVNSLKVKFSNIDTHKMQVEGAILVPNEPILRVDEKTGEHYFITFSSEVIEKIHNNFMKKKITDKTNLEHDEESELSGNYLIESYIIREELQNTKLNLPIGSAVAKYQITDEKFFKEKILTKEVEGFSLEGEFTFKEKLHQVSEKKIAENKQISDFDLLKELLYL